MSRVLNKKFSFPTITSLLIMLSLSWSTLNPIYGQESPPTGIHELSKVKIDEKIYFYTFEFCSIKNNFSTSGVLLSTDAEIVPVVIDKKIQRGECQTYGTRIYIDKSDKITTSLFFQDEITKIAEKLEITKKQLEEKIAQNEQKFRMYKALSEADKSYNDRVKKLYDEIVYQNKLLESAKSSLMLIRSMR